MTAGAAYQAYLRSPYWLRFSDRLKALCGCCEFCGADIDPLHVHHLTYERLGREQPGDVMALCWSCHGDVHEFPAFRSQVEGFARRRREMTLQRQGDPSWGVVDEDIPLPAA